VTKDETPSAVGASVLARVALVLGCVLGVSVLIALAFVAMSGRG
jgi:hypothetical protein